MKLWIHNTRVQDFVYHVTKYLDNLTSLEGNTTYILPHLYHIDRIEDEVNMV